MEPSLPLNSFRAYWLYRRLPAGDEAIAAGRGLSPAFMKLLEAVNPNAPVSFTALEARFSHLDADDLELWLAELCRMGLIVPAQETAAAVSAALPSADDPAAPFTAEDIHAPVAAVPACARRPDLLLVHKLPSTRLAWRDLLCALPVNLHEAGTLEEANDAYNRLMPAGVVVGPEGGDFNALSMIHLLKHPRAPRVTKVILVLDERSFSSKIKNAAASADDTVAPEAWDSLAERVARHLSLPKAALAAARPLRLMEDYDEAARSGLEHEHPRVAAVIAGQWGQSSLDGLFDQLIFDARGDGHSFSHEAMQDLLFLYRVHCELRPGDAWRTAGLPRSRRARIAALRATGRHRSLTSAGQISIM
ncbi:MAG: hypothetical protein JWN73_4430 [Betaproteobacteria bacterium]|nr:hypothetical protein [Betaproteobacteria bacterium]